VVSHAVVDHGDTSVQMDLERALACLRPVERLCVVLAYGERMSHGEICSATGLPLGTVKSHISRGSARLRQYLSDYEVDVR
jgi:RNA polymerase sigma-70 factor (ECF subfamily)